MGTWRATLAAAQDDVNSALEDAGSDARCVLDVTTLNVPGVYIRLDALAAGTLAGDVAAVSVYVVAPDADTIPTILDTLQDLTELVQDVIPAMSATTLVALPLPGGGTPAPAIRYTHDLILDD